jgi:hypothetical protein
MGCFVPASHRIYSHYAPLRAVIANNAGIAVIVGVSGDSFLITGIEPVKHTAIRFWGILLPPVSPLSAFLSARLTPVTFFFKILYSSLLWVYSCAQVY